MSQLPAVTQDNFAAEVLEAGGPVLVDFWAPWCGPCRALGPVIEKLALEMADKLKVVKLNVDDAPDLATKYGIQSIPTLLAFKAGQEAARIIGFLPEAELRRRLAELAP
jgi:thioredoxin 1